MHKALIKLALICLIGAVLGAMPVTDARSGAGAPGSIGGALQHQPLWTPVLVWRDCQRIARCRGCAPVYRCRSCTYQRTCNGLCEWADVCIWGPYLPLAPRGVRIIE
jgi:hypothetical protein